jgi:hypothetical protein
MKEPTLPDGRVFPKIEFRSKQGLGRTREEY